LSSGTQQRAVGKARQTGDSSMHKEEGRTVESAVEARGGFLGRPVLVVLVASVALVIILYAFIFMGFFGTS
jgi:hypothetical protein